MQNGFIRLKDAAKLLNVSERTLHRWIERHDLPFYRPGRTILFDPTELVDFVKVNCRVEAD